MDPADLDQGRDGRDDQYTDDEAERRPDVDVDAEEHQNQLPR